MQDVRSPRTRAVTKIAYSSRLFSQNVVGSSHHFTTFAAAGGGEMPTSENEGMSRSQSDQVSLDEEEDDKDGNAEGVLADNWVERQSPLMEIEYGPAVK